MNETHTPSLPPARRARTLLVIGLAWVASACLVAAMWLLAVLVDGLVTYGAATPVLDALSESRFFLASAFMAGSGCALIKTKGTVASQWRAVAIVALLGGALGSLFPAVGHLAVKAWTLSF